MLKEHNVNTSNIYTEWEVQQLVQLHGSLVEAPCAMDEGTDGTYRKQERYTTRTAFFWAITQGAMVISYRRFGTTYQSIFRRQETWFWIIDRWRWER
jgi:hypothetical protein